MTKVKEKSVEPVETMELLKKEAEVVIDVPIKENEPSKGKRDFRKGFDKDSWKPKTNLGRIVKLGEIKNLSEIIQEGERILEPEIVDFLLPHCEIELIETGQSKGKFGGGKRSIWRQTQKKTKEGNRLKFAAVVASGNRDGYVGLGKGKAKETVPAREKAIRNSKLNIINVRRGCGSWSCECGQPHSIPYTVTGKCGSVIIKLMPAPRGTGLIVEKECRKMINLAGIKDIYSKTYGKGGTKLNLVNACFSALRSLTSLKLDTKYIKKAGVREGLLKDGEQ